MLLPFILPLFVLAHFLAVVVDIIVAFGYVVKNTDNVFFLRDVNIEEPSLPIQLATRCRVNIAQTSYKLIASDHDFHVVNFTSNVTLLTKIHANSDDNGGLPRLCKVMYAITKLINMFLVYVKVFGIDICITLIVCRVHACALERLHI
jgi:hypothetical protein